MNGSNFGEQQINYNVNDIGKYTPVHALYAWHIKPNDYKYNHTCMSIIQSPHLVEMTLDQQTGHQH